MARIFARIIFLFLFPGGILAAAAVVGGRHDTVAAFIGKFVWLFPYPVLGAAFFLAWRFNKSRLLYGVVFCLMLDALLVYSATGRGPGGMREDYFLQVFMVLLPLNFLGYSLWKERGIFTLLGGLRLLLIVLQFLVAVGIYKYWGADILRSLSSRPLEVPYADIRIGLHAFVLNSAVLVVTAFRFFRYRDPMEHGFFWSMALGIVSLMTEEPGFVSRFYFSACGFILIIAALESAHRMAYRDELTGLPGRRALNEKLLMLGGIYSVAMVDIDFFKKFNDRYGHDVGDQVLRMVAGKLKHVSGGGRAFRYGGEEFTIIFPGKTMADVLPHLEKVRQTVADAGFVIRGSGRPQKRPRLTRLWGTKKKVSVTVSIGVAERESRRQQSQALLNKADKALYRAKSAGRNRVAQ